MMSNIKNHTTVMYATLILSALFIAPSSFANTLTIKIPQQNSVLDYPHPVRLEQVFSDIITQSNTRSPNDYSIGNKLFNLDKAEQSQQLKQQVLNDLQVLLNEKKSDAASIQIIIDQITQWQVGYRETLNLDFDTIRMQSQANPMLSGHFEFLTTQRTPRIHVEGLLFAPQSMELKSNKSLEHYIDQISPLSSAHSSDAWVIYPDGHYIRAGYAYWNNQNIQLIPGTVVFLGFNSDSTDSLKLEERIVKLITMRKSTK